MEISNFSAAPVLNKTVTEAAGSHKSTVMGAFGKVSPVTGWRAVFRGEFFGHGKTTGLTGSSLLTNIASTHGQTIADKVGQQLGLSAASNTPISSYKVAKAVALVEAESDWTKVHTTSINYAQVDEKGKSSGAPSQCTVTLTPLGRLKSLAKSSGVFGVSSTDMNNENAVNGWVEEMRMGSSSDKPTTSFVRSGMLMPPKAKSKDGAQEPDEAKSARTATARNRYTQILSSLVETTPSLIPADFKPENYTKENPFPFEHAHIGLLSANQGKESAMAQDQMNFIKNNVDGKPVQIDYAQKDGTVTKLWVKPTVLYTNFSVQKAQKKGEEAALLSDNTRDAETEKTLDHYLGKVDEEGKITSGGRELEIKIRKKLIAEAEKERPGSSDSPLFEKKLQTSEEWKLLQEVRSLRSTRSQEGSSFYSYEFQTKYSLLLAKCGIPTHVYCKSGKDRTSRFSEMAKMWAANPGLKLNTMTRATRNLIKAFSFSGNATVQRLCTGFAGNKQFKTYWRLIAGEKKDRTFGGWSQLGSVGSYSGWGASTLVKT